MHDRRWRNRAEEVPPGGSGLRGAHPRALGVTRERLVLWDIDSTLVRAGPFGRVLYAAAFEQATGRPMRLQSPTHGRLDPDIFRDTLVANDLDPAAHPFPAFAGALAAAYQAGAERLAREGTALPGAASALEALAARPRTVQTVLTGNVRPVARVKLAAFGLDRHVDLAIGAYGDDAEQRAGLVDVAWRRASGRRGAAFDAAGTVLVGDSVHDVTAGRSAGVRVVAVATGRDSRDELAAAGADVVLDDLGDTAVALDAIWFRLGP
jgi:phosphoglycolate phosphatase-like HAD superfamily hydrolase